MIAQAVEEEDHLEALDRSKGYGGISTAMRTVFEVLYEADEPLEFETIATKTWDRVPPPVRYHARRAWLRQKSSRPCRRRSCTFGTRTVKRTQDPSVEDAWRPWLTSIVRQAAYRGVLLRDGSIYRPNPDKAPIVLDADGRRRRFTRDLWKILTAEERTAGELSILPMHIRGVVPDDPAQLDDLIVLAIRFWGKQPTRRIHRPVRQLLELASTDPARRWLLCELARRRYAPDG